MRVLVTIAVFNEEGVLGSVLRRLPPDVDVLVVDDGSTDGTAEIARSHGARVVRHPINLGQGLAVMTGFKAALLHDYDVVVEMDGDGQHDPEDIPRFIEALKSREDDIVVGSRRLGSSYRAPFFRRVFLPFFTWCINRLTGYRLTDSMCGFRAFRTPSLRRVAPVLDRLDEPQYVAAEMFIRFAREGLTVSEIPIHISARGYGVSYKGLLRYGLGVTKAILKGHFIR